MSSITLTAAMRANLLSLQQTGKDLSTTQLALATGNKVNSALDNPVNFFASQALNQRASSLSALLDGMGQGIQTIQATNQGITSVTALVNQLTSIANTAKQDLAKVTTQQVLETSGGAIPAGINSAGVADLTTANTAITAGSTFSLQDGVGGPVQDFTVATAANGGNGLSLQNVADQINGSGKYTASIVYGDGTTVSAGTGVMQSGQAYLKVTSNDGAAISALDVGAGNALAGLGFGASSTAVTTGGAAADNAAFQAVLTQINATVSDSNYQGNNLIAGAAGADLVVQVNELSTNAITVTHADLTTASTGLNLAGNNVSTTGGVTAAITAINAALSNLQTTASGFANSLSLLQNRQNFTTNLVNTLQDGASQLTIADKNQEGAQLLALQTQQQLGIQALSLSSQANQSVLRLFA